MSKRSAQLDTTDDDSHKRAKNAMVKARGQGYGAPVDDVTQLVGNTPLVKISDKICPAGRTIYAKCEYLNPLSSVKDRLAVAIVEDLERQGRLRPGDTLVEASSGNTGIALAMVAAQRGYNCVITMAESFSVERRRIMRMLGAKVVVTPKALKAKGMVDKAIELCEKNPAWHLCHQFETEANWKFHEATTGPEIVNDLKAIASPLDYWVTGTGTGGTYHGAGKYIKEHSPDTKIIMVEPQGAALVQSGVPTPRLDDGSPKEGHPEWNPHPIQGWTPDFIPKVLEDGLPLKLHDEIVICPGQQGIHMAQELARKEGIFTGISGGSTMWAAVQVAQKAPAGSVVVTMLPDTAERYLSTPLFADIAAEMDAEEWAIAQSTPTAVLSGGGPQTEG